MTKTIILTSENIVVDDGLNNKLKYSFPSTVTFKDDLIALASVNMYYSWYNISQSNNNNSFSYLWPGDLDETVVSLPDSHMEITTLNSYLQSVFVSNGHYMENSSGDFVYFGELRVNSSTYKIEFISYKLYTETEANELNLTKPSNATWIFPSEGDPVNIQLKIQNNNFGDIIGFESGTFPSSDSVGYDITTSSTKAPNVAVTSSVVVTCSIARNNIAIPNNILYSFPSGNSQFGSHISLQHELIYTEIQNGQTNELIISFLDQNLKDIPILDKQMNVILSIKNKYEGTDLEQKK